MKNKVITTNGNIQFVSGDGKVINVSPTQVYSVYGEDNVSFLLVHFHKTSGLALMTSMVSDLELNGQVYSSVSALEDAIADAWSKAGSSLRCEIVDELPTVGQENVIYLVPSEDPAEMNVYSEYIWQNGEFEKLGDTSVQIDLDNYYTKTETNALLDDKVDVTTFDSTNLVVSRSLNDLNTRKLDASAYTPTDLSNYYNKTEVNGLLDDKADVSALTATNSRIDTVSGDVATKADAADVYTKSEVDTKIAEIDLSDYYDKTEVDGLLDDKQDTLVAGDNITISGNVISAIGGAASSAITSGDTNAVAGGAVYDRFDEVEQVTAAALNNLDEKKLDASAYTPTDLSNYYTKSQVYTKAETNSAISSATSGKADSSSVYTYVAADNRITVATTTGNHRKAIGLGVDVYKGSGSQSLSLISQQGTGQGANNIKGALSTGIGWGLSTNNLGEVAVGQYNKSVSASTTFGNSGNTLFSIGNGQYQNQEQNAFEVRQNGDIYIVYTNDTSSTTWYKPMVKLQDTITATAANTTALGGLKLVKLSQSEYDSLSTKDSNTLYIING